MPKRSNEFQKLVYLVKRQMAGSATVTESKPLKDRLTGTGREVDICIETSVGGHPLTISIECRDHGRRADVSWVEEMKAKHERLNTNALVLASRSGFTKEALRVAKLSGIETLTLQGLKEETVDRILGAHGSLWAKELTLSATKVVMRVAAVGDLPAENVATSPDNWLHSVDDEVLGSVREYVEAALRSRKVMEAVGRDAKEEHISFILEWESPKNERGEPLCLKKLEPGILRPIELVRIHGSLSCMTTEFRLKHGTLGEVKVAWATGKLLGKQSLLVASQVGSDKELVTVHIEGTPQRSGEGAA